MRPAHHVLPPARSREWLRYGPPNRRRVASTPKSGQRSGRRNPRRSSPRSSIFGRRSCPHYRGNRSWPRRSAMQSTGAKSSNASFMMAASNSTTTPSSVRSGRKRSRERTASSPAATAAERHGPQSPRCWPPPAPIMSIRMHGCPDPRAHRQWLAKQQDRRTHALALPSLTASPTRLRSKRCAI